MNPNQLALVSGKAHKHTNTEAGYGLSSVEHRGIRRTPISPCAWTLCKPQKLRRARSAAVIVPSSRWSNSPPTGTPWASPVTETPQDANWSAM